MVDELAGAWLTRDACRQEGAFDRSLAQQPLGQNLWRPSIVLKPRQRDSGYCPLLPCLWTPEDQALALPPGTPRPRVSSLEAEIGWGIAAPYQNQGYATEAAPADHLWGATLRLPRILAFTSHENRASLRVMEKLGMRLSPNPRTAIVVGGIETDGTAGGDHERG